MPRAGAVGPVDPVAPTISLDDSLSPDNPLLLGPEVTTLDNGSKVTRSNKQLGHGTFGVVYKGILQDKSGRVQEAAIKFAGALEHSPHGNKALEALQTEETVFGQVPVHKNIIRYLGSKKNTANDEGLFIVLEYMPQNLKAAIQNDSRLKTFRTLLGILKDVVEGMIHLQNYDVIHHDLKPENILLDSDLTPKVADFGASKIRHAQSMTAAFRGTLGYMAPESKIGGWVSHGSDFKIKVCAQAVDVFSFGVILWECATGGWTSMATQGDKFIMWGGLRPGKVPCNCPLELRDLIEECVRFDIKADKSTTDYGRPSFRNILERLTCMLETCPWLDNPLPCKPE